MCFLFPFQGGSPLEPPPRGAQAKGCFIQQQHASQLGILEHPQGLVGQLGGLKARALRRSIFQLIEDIAQRWDMALMPLFRVHVVVSCSLGLVLTPPPEKEFQNQNRILITFQLASLIGSLFGGCQEQVLCKVNVTIK
jgi:hypothetical protein